MEGSAGEGALLLLGREVSPFAAHILSARGLAQGVVQGFDVVGTQLLHPSAAEQALAGASRSPFSASAGTKV